MGLRLTFLIIAVVLLAILAYVIMRQGQSTRNKDSQSTKPESLKKPSDIDAGSQSDIKSEMPTSEIIHHDKDNAKEDKTSEDTPVTSKDLDSADKVKEASAKQPAKPTSIENVVSDKVVIPSNNKPLVDDKQNTTQTQKKKVTLDPADNVFIKAPQSKTDDTSVSLNDTLPIFVEDEDVKAVKKDTQSEPVAQRKNIDQKQQLNKAQTSGTVSNVKKPKTALDAEVKSVEAKSKPAPAKQDTSVTTIKPKTTEIKVQPKANAKSAITAPVSNPELKQTQSEQTKQEQPVLKPSGQTPSSTQPLTRNQNKIDQINQALSIAQPLDDAELSLSLAQQYIDVGEYDSAKRLIQEVMNGTATQAQKDTAKQLRDRIY